MPSWLKDRILTHVSQRSYIPVKTKQLRRDLKIEKDHYDLFNDAILSLLSESKIKKIKGGLWTLPAMPDEIVGRYVKTKRGFGFVDPELFHREGGLLIDHGYELDALEGDLVKAEVFPRTRHKARLRGRILSIIERRHSTFTGTLKRELPGWRIYPDGKVLNDPVIVHDISSKGGKEGDKVHFELLQWPKGDWLAEGVILSVLGKSGLPTIEEKAVILNHGLRMKFNEEQLKQSRESNEKFNENIDPFNGNREDCTHKVIFTIDPPSARDFDDAISIEFNKTNNTFELGVHIADVSSFISRGSPLDIESASRANSVYLPQRVIPMIPEALSNGICSLQEGVDRWTKSVFITFDIYGKVISQRFSATKIRSKKRFTYIEAQMILDGKYEESKTFAKTETHVSREVIDSLNQMKKLTDLLIRRRQRNGMIELDLPQAELVFSDEGHVVDVVPEDESFTHKIIEMFMIEANEAVARLFYDLEIPILRRTHPEPMSGDFESLVRLAGSLGYQMSSKPGRKDFQLLLNKTRLTKASRGIHFAVLRTMSRAQYQINLIGHWALASHHYAHFTSPIRRYADLLVHRTLTVWLERTNNGTLSLNKKEKAICRSSILDNEEVNDEVNLSQIGNKCSHLERNAEEAERSLRTYLILQYLEKNYLGDDLVAYITGFNRFTVRLILDKYLIPVDILHEDLSEVFSKKNEWKYVDSIGKLVQRSSGSVLKIGDSVVIRLTHVDLCGRNIGVSVTSIPKNKIIKDEESKSNDFFNKTSKRKDFKRGKKRFKR